jgi:hypothetical protein
MTLPFLVTRKRFAVPLCVFSFGMMLSLYIRWRIFLTDVQEPARMAGPCKAQDSRIARRTGNVNFAGAIWPIGCGGRAPQTTKQPVRVNTRTGWRISLLDDGRA